MPEFPFHRVCTPPKRPAGEPFSNWIGPKRNFSSTFIIRFVEPEREIPAAAPRDESHDKHQCGVEKERKPVAVGVKQVPEQIHDKGANHHGQVVHRHDERQREGRRCPLFLILSVSNID